MLEDLIQRANQLGYRVRLSQEIDGKWHARVKGDDLLGKNDLYGWGEAIEASDALTLALHDILQPKKIAPKQLSLEDLDI